MVSVQIILLSALVQRLGNVDLYFLQVAGLDIVRSNDGSSLLVRHLGLLGITYRSGHSRQWSLSSRGGQVSCGQAPEGRKTALQKAKTACRMGASYVRLQVALGDGRERIRPANPGHAIARTYVGETQ